MLCFTGSRMNTEAKKNMAGVELHAKDTVAWLFQICSLSKLATLFVQLPFLKAHHSLTNLSLDAGDDPLFQDSCFKYRIDRNPKAGRWGEGGGGRNGEEFAGKT